MIAGMNLTGGVVLFVSQLPIVSAATPIRVATPHRESLCSLRKSRMWSPTVTEGREALCFVNGKKATRPWGFTSCGLSFRRVRAERKVTVQAALPATCALRAWIPERPESSP